MSLTLEEAARLFVDRVEAAGRARAARGAGGQQVPYHDDFAYVNPSTARELARWAEVFRTALSDCSPESK